MDIISKITQTVQALCAIGNIVALIVFAHQERKYAIEAQNRDSKRISKARGRLWYEKLIIDRVVENVTELYTCLFNSVNENKYEDINESIKAFGKQIDQCIHNINPFLKLFSPELSKTVVRKINDTRDTFYKSIIGLSSDSPVATMSKIESDCSFLLDKLYRFDFEEFDDLDDSNF